MRVDWKTQFKSYSFWLSVASACLLLFQAVGKPLGLNVNEANYMSIVNAVLGVFVLFGIIAPAATIDEQKDDDYTILNEDDLTKQTDDEKTDKKEEQ